MTQSNDKLPFYFTFGQDYHGFEHPVYPKAHKDGWVTIMAEDYRAARMKSIEVFGLNDSGAVQFAFQYDDTDFKPEYYRLGEIERIEA